MQAIVCHSTDLLSLDWRLELVEINSINWSLKFCRHAEMAATSFWETAVQYYSFFLCFFFCLKTEVNILSWQLPNYIIQYWNSSTNVLSLFHFGIWKRVRWKWKTTQRQFGIWLVSLFAYVKLFDGTFFKNSVNIFETLWMKYVRHQSPIHLNCITHKYNYQMRNNAEHCYGFVWLNRKQHSIIYTYSKLLFGTFQTFVSLEQFAIHYWHKIPYTKFEVRINYIINKRSPNFLLYKKKSPGKNDGGD